MRPTELVRFIDTRIAGVTLTKGREARLANNAVAHEYRDLAKLRESASALLTLEPLAEQARAVLRHPAMKTGLTEVVASVEEGTNLEHLVFALRKDALDLANALRGSVIEDTGLLVEIQLPPDLDLEGYAEAATTLAALFDRTSKDLSLGAVGFAGGERGSPDWITVSVGGDNALQWIAALVALLYAFHKRQRPVATLQATIRVEVGPDEQQVIDKLRLRETEKELKDLRDDVRALAQRLAPNISEEQHTKAVEVVAQEVPAFTALADKGMTMQLSPKSAQAVTDYEAPARAQLGAAKAPPALPPKNPAKRDDE